LTLELHSPLDMHLHLREGAMLECVAPLSAETFAGAVIMPNLMPPVDNLERLLAYREAILDAIRPHTFEPYMTLFMRPYKQAELAAAREHIIGIKLYPAGVTTNSEAGMQGIADAYPTLAIMEEMKIPLMVHGETMGFVMDREREFLSVYEELAERFPRLRITMEHITTREAVALLDRYENLMATVTLQHLVCTLDDLAGGKLDPHLFCKPILKRPEDREALLKAALEAHPRLMFGSDSAPHPVDQKECCGCAAGVFTAPHALASLAELFEHHGALDKLQAFVSDNARELHGLTPPPKTVRLEKKESRIPVRHGEVVPFRAGATLTWSA
jgi:dihydroorotase